MQTQTRRTFLAGAAAAALGASAAAAMPARAAEGDSPSSDSRRSEPAGSQRLSLAKLRKWESLQYGMFIHFGMSTFVQQEMPDGKAPLSMYNPDRLNVDQWVSVARDAGMKYLVLTAKHVAGHCLWPSKYTSYTVANSPNKTNVCEQFCKSCEKRGVLPGFYYCSWDNHHRFGSKTPSDGGGFGEMGQVPHVRAQPGAVHHVAVSELSDRAAHRVADAIRPDRGDVDRHSRRARARLPKFPLRAHRRLAAGNGRYDEQRPQRWIELPRPLRLAVRSDRHGAEPSAGLGPQEMAADRRARAIICPAKSARRSARIGGSGSEATRCAPDGALAAQFDACRLRGANLLLDVPPDVHGVIPEEAAAALMRLRKNAKI